MSDDSHDGKPQPRQTPFLRISALCRTYDNGSVHALNNVSFDVARGEYVAIMGPSGSGKSTLLNLLGGLDRPTSGDIELEGQPFSRLADPDQFRARTLGFVFQAFHLLPTLTAVENVQIPMFEGPLGRQERAARALELLTIVGLSHRVGHLPSKLSTGERQRVAIARALANNPRLVLADEPTGNLDSALTAGVMDIFDRLHREHGLTLVIVTHDHEVAARAGRTITLRDGRIAASSLSAREPAPCGS
jgi:ABC-type lipoprotein export system ATPase subunit